MIVAPIAAGVGVWFLMRNIWRSMVNEVPDNGFVRWGLGRPPIARKAMAVAVSFVVAFVVALGVGVVFSNFRSSSNSNTHSNTSVTQPATTDKAAGTVSDAAATDPKDKASSTGDGEGSEKSFSDSAKEAAGTASTSTR